MNTKFDTVVDTIADITNDIATIGENVAKNSEVTTRKCGSSEQGILIQEIINIYPCTFPSL